MKPSIYEFLAIIGVTFSLATVNQILQTCILVIAFGTSVYGAYLQFKNSKQKTK
jgi:hypothetical protein